LPALRQDRFHGTLPSEILCTYFDKYLIRHPTSWSKIHFRLPPSENGEWWEIGDMSRGGIPYYYHTKTGETVWEKPDGFVIPLTVLQVCAISLSVGHTDFNRPNRIPHLVVVSQSRSLRRLIRPHLPVLPGKIRVLRLTIRVHIRKRPQVKLPAVCGPLRVAQLPLRRRVRTHRLCVATTLPTPIFQHQRNWRLHSRPSQARKRALRPPPPLRIPLSFLLAHHHSRWELLSNA
jgi:hypothetical protein